MKFQNLLLKQMDGKLELWNGVSQQLSPAKGWVNLIRTCLGLSSYKLAKLMGVNQARVMKIEKSEQSSAITLKTLERAAEAMNCCVVYGIVPKTTLKNILEKRAKQIAAKRMSHASYSMGLEAQSVDKEKNQEQFDELVQELLSGSAKKLWDDK
ncbi:MAG: hypothetical protein COB50_02160 [Thiotrichales bacterium]|nr:MAG: hypothetical protein COB50_02160 [Thiotrichales bacterium]